MDNKIDPIQEIDAMRKVADALTPLGADACRRVLSWASDHFGIQVAPTKIEKAEEITPAGNDSAPNSQPHHQYDNVAELYAVAQPSTDAEKALVVSYWTQCVQGIEGVDSQSVNTQLKHMGYGIGNVTRAFEVLKQTKPQLIVQLRKSGSSKQARKTYKVTTEGEKYVQQMLNRG